MARANIPVTRAFQKMDDSDSCYRTIVDDNQQALG
jgi:osmoprotectant transport system ATP-binding protein